MKYITLKEFTKEYSQKNKNEECRDVYSITNSAGFIPSNDYFSKDVYSKDLSNYKRVLRRMIAYNPSRINVGSVALQDKDDEVIVSPLYVVFDIDEDIVLAEFLEKFLHSDVALMQIRGLTSGSVRDSLKFSALQKVRIPLINIDKQHVIVENLVKIQTLINEESRYLKKLDLLVKSRFIEMFGDPVANPEKWDIVTLDHCLENIDNGRSFVCDGNARTGDNPAILKLSAATYGVYKPNENKAIINVEDFVESAEVHAGDLLFTRKNTPDLVGMAAYVASTPKKLMMPDLIFRLNTKDICNKIFLWQLINHDLFRGRIQSIASGSAKSMSNISKERLGKMMLYLPPIDLQTQFADFVHQVDKSKLAVEKNLEKLELLKKSLMQQYFG